MLNEKPVYDTPLEDINELDIKYDLALEGVTHLRAREVFYKDMCPIATLWAYDSGSGEQEVLGTSGDSIWADGDPEAFEDALSELRDQPVRLRDIDSRTLRRASDVEAAKDMDPKGYEAFDKAVRARHGTRDGVVAYYEDRDRRVLVLVDTADGDPPSYYDVSGFVRFDLSSW